MKGSFLEFFRILRKVFQELIVIVSKKSNATVIYVFKHVPKNNIEKNT